jgi:hypothetical protein
MQCEESGSHATTILDDTQQGHQAWGRTESGQHEAEGLAFATHRGWHRGRGPYFDAAGPEHRASVDRRLRCLQMAAGG